MTRVERGRWSELTPWVFLFALMAIAITVVLVTFAMPSSLGLPYSFP